LDDFCLNKPGIFQPVGSKRSFIMKIYGEDEMGATNLVMFLLIGLIAGWLSGMIMRGGGFGLVGDLVVGVIGAFLGGWIFSLLKVSVGGILGSLITSLIGAIVLLFLVRLIKRM
jgi:uncharacterized membrane protein YeaQ/YmgE (transglycosylase-associated protein family)